MGKMKVDIFFYLIADIFIKVLEKYSLSCPCILSNLPDLIGCHGN